MSQQSAFRQIQKIEIGQLFGALCMLTALYLALEATPVSVQPSFPEVVRLCTFLTAFSVICVTFLAKHAYRVVALATHAFVFIVALFALEGTSLVAEILLLMVFETQLAFRMSPVPSVLTNGAVLLVATAIALVFNTTIVDRLIVLSVGGVCVLAFVAVTVYREQLLEKTNALVAQRSSIENLTAATHSFVTHLESVEAESAQHERERITREIHDALGYAMTNIMMMMNASRHLLQRDPDKLLEYCSKTRQLAREALEETRQTLYLLRAVGRYRVPDLSSFFIKMCEDFSVATGVRTDIHVGNLPRQLDDAVFNILLHAVQVAFVNALRHGNAGHIELSFWVSDCELRMWVWNDSHDVDVGDSPVREGIGLTGIRERLAGVKGYLSAGQVMDGYMLLLTIPKEELSYDTDSGSHS